MLNTIGVDIKDLIPCRLSPPPVTSTVVWVSGDYSYPCYIQSPYKIIGDIPCAYIGHLLADGEVDRKRGVSIVPVSQLFISPAEVQFMAYGESFH